MPLLACLHTFTPSLSPYFCPRFSSKTPWLRRGRFRKLSFNTERARERAAESETDEPELDISSRLGRRGRGHTLALDALRSSDRVQSEREERQGLDFMSLQSDSETFFADFWWFPNGVLLIQPTAMPPLAFFLRLWPTSARTIAFI